MGSCGKYYLRIHALPWQNVTRSAHGGFLLAEVPVGSGWEWGDSNPRIGDQLVLERLFCPRSAWPQLEAPPDMFESAEFGRPDNIR